MQGLGRKQRSRPKLAEVVQATTTIQRAYRRFRKRKEEKMMVVKKCEQPQTRLKSQKLRQEHPKKTSLTSQVLNSKLIYEMNIFICRLVLKDKNQLLSFLI